MKKLMSLSAAMASLSLLASCAGAQQTETAEAADTNREYVIVIHGGAGVLKDVLKALPKEHLTPPAR